MKNLNLSRIAVIAVALLSVSATACKKQDAAPLDTTSIGPVTPAVLKVSEVQLGRSIGMDKRVTDATTTFGNRDTLYLAVVTDGAATSATLGTRWTYNDKQVVDSASQTIAPTGGTNVTEFHLTKPSGWPKGNYKVEVMLNSSMVDSKTFEVK